MYPSHRPKTSPWTIAAKVKCKMDKNDKIVLINVMTIKGSVPRGNR